jgi:hypothetical protein
MEHHVIFSVQGFSSELWGIWLLLREPGKMALTEVMKKFKEKKKLRRNIV